MAAESLAANAPSVTPWSGIAQGAGSLISAFATYYATKQQIKAQREANAAQERMWEKQLGWEREQFGQTMGLQQQQLGFQREQAGASNRLAQEQLRQSQQGIQLSARQQRAQEKLAKKQLKLQETGQAAEIALGQRGMALQEKASELEAQNQRFNQMGMLIANMTKFYSSPNSRAALAQMYQRRR